MSLERAGPITLQAAAVATGNGLPMRLAGLAGAVISVEGTFVGTVTWEATADDINATSPVWVAVNAINLTTGAIATTATVTGLYAIATPGLGMVRARVSAWTSGTITAIGRAALSAGPVPGILSASMATAVTGASGNVAATATTAALPAVAGKTNYVTGFQVTGGGATAGSLVLVTLTGVITGTLTYVFAVPAGATLGAVPLIVTFSTPIPASAVNTAITVNVPSLGTGNTNAAAAIQGFVA